MGAKLDNLMQQYGIMSGNGFASGGRVRTHYQTGGQAGEDNLEDLDRFYQNPTNRAVPFFPRPRSPASSPVMSPSDPGYLDRLVSQPIGINPPNERNILDPNSSYERLYPASATRRALPPGIMPIENVGEGVGIVEEPPARLSGLMEISNVGEGFPVSGNVEPPEGGSGNAPARTSSPASSASPLEGMLERYLTPTGSGSRELTEARRRSQSESEAFYNMIRQMAERGESPTSRAEMYFRLASAFGAPTRTGTFGETLSNVGKELGEYTKGRRAEEAERRGLMLRAQEARMAGAREELSTTRALAAQEATERRAIANTMLQEYIRSGRPQSNAGRAAIDAGLRPGTPEFQDFVRRQTEIDIERTRQLIQTQAENLELRRRQSESLSPTEIRLADETQQNLSTARDNLYTLRRALELNERSTPSNLTEGVITSLRRRLGSTAPEVVNTAELQNMLSRLTLASLKETFPGAISNDERRALEAVSGVTAQSREERRRILQNAIENLERVAPRYEEKVREIRSGRFGRIEQ